MNLAIAPSHCRTVFHADRLRIGHVRYPSLHPAQFAEGQTTGWLLVFPRTPLLVVDGASKAAVVDASTVRFYNRGQSFRRRSLCDAGARCDWFSYDRESVAEAVRPFDAAVDARHENPFARSQACVDAALYFMQRRVFLHASSGAADPLHVEEAMQALLARAVAASYARRDAPREPSGARRAQVEIVEEVERTLAVRFREHLTLSEIAAQVGCSPFHLARIFRAHTGTSVHAHRLRLRLCAALDEICDGSRELTDIALELGFASHSHLTDSFRKVFGVPPRDVRRSRTDLREVADRTAGAR